jgi:hypothetical protein
MTTYRFPTFIRRRTPSASNGCVIVVLCVLTTVPFKSYSVASATSPVALGVYLLLTAHTYPSPSVGGVLPDEDAWPGYA